MNLLLDTCAFLWLAASPDRISARARSAMDDPDNSLWISDISIWEIAMKHAVGKLTLPALPRIWIPEQVSFFQLNRLHLEEQAIYLSGELSAAHRDPFDRLIAAQSKRASMPLVTSDTCFHALGVEVIW